MNSENVNDIIPLVSICCITYNHEKFISDAIEGFLMQETNFRYEIIIHEDASIDNTAKIIEQYAAGNPDLIFPVLQTENKYSQGIKPLANFVLPRARGSYIALCEGDDYWGDPLKLQKQVDFLEKNTDFSLCVSGFMSNNIHTNRKRINITVPPGVKLTGQGYEFSLMDTMGRWLTKTLTAVFRNYPGLGGHLVQYKHGVDINLFYHILKNGNGFYMTEVTGVYRIHEGGVFSMKHDWDMIINRNYKIYKEIYLLNKDEYSRICYLNHILALLNTSIHRHIRDEAAKSNFMLFFSAIKLLRTVKEAGRLISLFFKRRQSAYYILPH